MNPTGNVRPSDRVKDMILRLLRDMHDQGADCTRMASDFWSIRKIHSDDLDLSYYYVNYREFNLNNKLMGSAKVIMEGSYEEIIDWLDGTEQFKRPKEVTHVYESEW